MRSHLSSYLWFVDSLPRAAASLETSYESKPCCWKCCMRASILADGMTSRLRCDLVMRVGLDGMEESVVDPHTGGSDAETTTDSATSRLSV